MNDEQRLGKRIAHVLSEGTARLDSTVLERLRADRHRAVTLRSAGAFDLRARMTAVARGSVSATSMSGVHEAVSRPSFPAIRQQSSVNIQLTPGSLNWLAMVG